MEGSSGGYGGWYSQLIPPALREGKDQLGRHLNTQDLLAGAFQLWRGYNPEVTFPPEVLKVWTHFGKCTGPERCYDKLIATAKELRRLAEELEQASGGTLPTDAEAMLKAQLLTWLAPEEEVSS